ncbi:MAG: beta strand repeat-containing protein, partial [Dolichospermum sp.]
SVNSASGGGEVVIDGGDAVTERGIVYNTTGTPTTADTKVINGTGVGTFTANLTSLSSNTTYYVRAYAINGVGTGYGSEVNFTTLAAEPTTQSTVAFGTRTNTSLVVNFTGGNGGRRVVFVKQGSAVDYTPTDAVAPSGINAVFGAGTQFGTGNYAVYDGTGTTVTVTGLTKNTTYHIAVYEYTNNSVSSPNYFATAGTGNATTYNPTITVGSVTAFGNVVTATNSSSQSYTVEGTELVGSITINAPTGFAISLDDVDFSVNPIILAKNGSDAVPSTTIYVRFSPASATGATGSLNITHTSTDATTQNVAVSGNALAVEPTTVGTISFGTVTTTSIVVNLPTVGDGARRLILVKSGSAVDATPTDANSYTANAVFASGDQIGSGNYVIYNGTGSGNSLVTLTGLSKNVTYHFAVFEYNEGTGTSQNYYGTAATANQTTANESASTDAFRSFQTGNWNSTSTWESFSNGVWIAATLTPDASASTITILNTHTVSVTASISADEVTINSGGQITVNSGQTLTIANGTGTDITVNGILRNIGTLTLTGTMVVNNQAMYDHAVDGGTITLPSYPQITWNTGSTLKISGNYSTAINTSAGNLLGNATTSLKNVLIDCNFANDAFFSLSDGLLTLDTLTIAGTGNGGVTPTNRNTTTCGTYIQTGGLLYCNRASGSFFVLTVTGNVNINGGTLSLKSGANAGGGTLNVGGDLTVGASGTLTNSASTGFPNLTFNGSTAQTWNNAGTFSYSTAGNRITINNANGVTLNNSVTVGAIFLTAGTLSNASNLTVINSGTVTRTAGSFSGNPNYGTGVNVTFTGTSVSSGSELTPASGTIGTLTVNSSGNTYTLSNNVSVGAVALTAGTLDASTSNYAINVSGNWTRSAGSFTARSGTVTFNGTSTISGTNSFNNITVAESASVSTGAISIAGNLVNNNSFAATGAITFNGTANQTISGNGGTMAFTSITINNTGTFISNGESANDVVEFLSTNLSLSSTITLTQGIIKLSGAYSLTTPFGSGSFTIPANAGIWLNNSGCSVSANTGSLTLNGLLRITNGSITIGTAQGNQITSTSTTSYLFIEGGTLNLASRFSLTGAGATFNMTGGNFNICTASSTSTSIPSFNLPSGTIFLISGGNINLVQRNTAGTPFTDYLVAGSTTISGGTLNVGTAATATNFNFIIGGAIPNLVINNTTNNKTATLSTTTTVSGNIQINTGTTLTANSQNISLTGNWSNAGTFTNTGSTVTFNGTVTQTITKSGGETFNSLTVNKTSGTLQLVNNVQINNTLNYTAGNFDLAGNTLTFSGTTATVVTGTEAFVNSTGTGTIAITSGVHTVSGSSTPLLTYPSNVQIIASNGIDFGNGISTINGTLQINSGGYVVANNPPTYGSASTLRYNSGTTYGRFTEWSATSGAGYPNNVQISNNTTLDLGNGGTSVARQIAGNLTVDNGSTLTMNNTGNVMNAALTVKGNIANNGTITLAGLSGGDLRLEGNIVDNDTFNA